MIKKITLNEDHLKLIENIKFESFNFKHDSENARFGWGIDQYSLFGGTYLLEDAAIILGVYDKRIIETKDSCMGPRFPEEIEERIWAAYTYIWDNIEYILSLILFYINKGGLKPGTYTCLSEEKIWSFSNN